MKAYSICEQCGASLAGKRGTRGPRRFCDKSCAQSFRNGKRPVRTAPPPPPIPSVRFVPLTQGAFAMVDEADFADVSRWNWCVLKTRGLTYAMRARSPEERRKTGLHAPILLHRHLLGHPIAEVDHKNGNGLDCRRENLRSSSHANNARNSRSRNGSSRFKGVSLSRSRWCATIRVDYRTTHLGRFLSEEDAAHAYDEAARRLFGEFARVNFPRDGERSALHD